MLLSLRPAAREPAPANEVPSCDPVTRYVAPGETLNVLVSCGDSDVDHEGIFLDATHLLTLSVVTAPTRGTAAVSDYAHVSYAAGAGASGSDTFTIKATDPFGVASNTVTITIVFLANRVPSCEDVSDTGRFVLVSASCDDPDKDALTTVSITSPPAKGTITAFPAACNLYLYACHSITFLYAADDSASGTDTFSYTVTDERGGTSAPKTITIGIVNRAPECFASTVNTVAGATERLHSCSDPDQDVPSVTVVSPPAKGTLTLIPGNRPDFVYTSNPNASGSDSFSYFANDGRGGVSAIRTATLTFGTSNSAPSCSPSTLTIEPGASLVFFMACTDAEGHSPLTYAVASGPSKGTVTPEGFYALRYAAASGTSGADHFTVTATDRFGAVSVEAPVDVTIAPCTRAGSRFYRPLQAWYGSARQGAVTLGDGVQLSDYVSFGVWSIVRQSPGLDPRIREGLAFSDPWVPPFLTNLEWSLLPPDNLPAEANLRTQLAAVLDAPVFDAAVDHGVRNYLMDYYEHQEPCPGGVVHNVQYQFGAEISLFELNARESNRAPACANRTATVNAGAAVDVAPSCTDADSDPLSYAIGTQGAKGAASVVSGQLHYVANAGASGTDTFTYVADDGNGGVSGAATVTITITGSSTCQFGAQGCTTGYWKSNAAKYGAAAWPAGLTPSTKLSEVFAVPGCAGTSLGNSTLVQSLEFSNGKTLALAAQNLLRQATGAVLNASHSCVAFGACKSDVIARTNAALASCDRGRVNDLAQELERLNSASCPLDSRGICLRR